MNRSRSGKTKNNSLILSFFSFIFSQIGHLARQSVILGFFLNYDALENVCADRKICGKYVDFSRIKAHFLTIKLKCAKYSQESFLINLFEDAACRFFRASLRSFGIFLLSFGGFLVSVNLANGLPRLIHFDFSDTFLFGCILMIISLFMLPVKNKSIATALRDSKLFSYFLFDIFTIKHIAFTEQGKILPTSGISLALGLLCGLLSYAVSPWLTAFLIFLAVLMYMIFTRPENGILAVCLLLPFAGRKILSFLIILTLLSTAFKVIRGKRSLHFNLCSGVYMLFGVIAASGVVFSFDSENAFSSLGSILLALLFALNVITLIGSSSLADKCFRTLGFSVLTASLYGIYDYSVRYLSSHDLSGILRSLHQGGLRSAFEDSSSFAAFLVCLLPILFVNRQSTGKFFSLFAIALAAICLLYTNSYYALFSLIVAAIVVMVLFSRIGLWTTAFAAVSLYFIRLFMPNFDNGSFSFYVPRPEDLSSSLTGAYFDGVNEFFRKLWLSGAGVGTESVAGASTLIDAQLTGYHGIGATYMQLMMKIGIPLTLCSVILLAVFLSRLFSYAYGFNKSETAKSKCIALICSLFGIMLYAFFADLSGNFRLCVLFLLLLSLGCAVPDSADNDYIPPYFEREYN